MLSTIKKEKLLMKHYVKGVGVTFAALVLAACGGTTSSSSVTPSSSSPSSSEVALASITISGADDVTIPFNEPFNLKTGVTALGNNGTSYTSNITFSSTSTAVDTASGDLDTTKTGVHAVRYQVSVGGITAQKWRNVTVGQPTSTGMLVNPDFALGTAGWDSGLPFYQADGGTLALTTENGQLKADVVAGSQPFTPRFGQANIPFVFGKTYNVSFDAKSTAAKTIQVQIGQLFDGPPYFADFLATANTQYFNITTTLTTFSFQFTHNINSVDQTGALLFALGTVTGNKVDATMHFDNMVIEETVLGEDTTAPILSGVQDSVNVLVGATFNPLTGVSAFDAVDGDLTADIDVEILDDALEVVSAVDTSAPAVFTVNYTVADEAGNEATDSTTVNVVSMTFKDENLLDNGSFNTAIGDEWGFWQQDWGTPPVVARTQDTTAGTYSLDINGGGDAAWAIQFFQDGVSLVEGETYKLSVSASATVARTLSLGIGYGDPWNEYGRENGVQIGTSLTTVEYVFTVTKPSADVKVVLELGSQTGFANGVITLAEVRLQSLGAAPLLANGDFSNSGWRGFANTWDGTAFTAGVENGEFVMDVSAANVYESWHLQIVQDAESLAGIPGVSQFLDLEPSTDYVLKFDAYASEANVVLTPNIFSNGVFTNFVANPATTLTTTKTTYTLNVTTTAALNDTEKLAFEFGTGLPVGRTLPLSVSLDNVELTKAGVAVSTLYNGNMETVLGGHSFFSDNGGSFKNTDNGALVNVAAVGGQAYLPHYFFILPSLAVGNYEFKIALTADVSRDLRFNIVLPDAGFASIIEGGFIDFEVVEDVEKVFTVSFTVVNPITNVKFELDFGNLGAESTSLPGNFLISEVLVYRNYN